MTESNVHDIFTGKAIPVEESDFVQDFIEEHLGDFKSAVTDLEDSETEQEYRYHMSRVKRLVGRWPDD